MPTRKLKEVAHFLGGEAVGNEEEEIREIAPLETAGPGQITFLSNPKYGSLLRKCKASAVVVPLDFRVHGLNLIRVVDPYLALAKLIPLFQELTQHRNPSGERAYVDPGAEVAADVQVFGMAYVSRGVKIGARSIVYPYVFLGEGVCVGEDCILYPNVTIREGCSIGDRVIVHSGAVIGADGFGFAVDGGRRVKIPQVGAVEIGNDVEIGANTTIDRATLGATRIGHGVKIDNLVQIGHNVQIGDDSVIVSQTGISGSVKVGRGVILAAQVGVVGHVVIGDCVVAAGRSGITKSIPAGTRVAGFPAAEHTAWLRTQACVAKLTGLFQRVKVIERGKARGSARGGPHGDEC